MPKAKCPHCGYEHGYDVNNTNKCEVVCIGCGTPFAAQVRWEGSICNIITTALDRRLTYTEKARQFEYQQRLCQIGRPSPGLPPIPMMR